MSSANGLRNVVIKTPMGSNKVVFDLSVEGETVQGSVTGDKERSEISSGRADGERLSWRTRISRPIPMDLEFKALIDGDHISGGARSPFGTAPFAGTRG